MRTIIILLFITTFYTFAQTLDVNISLASHTNSDFGAWKLTKVTPNHLDTTTYKGKIVQSDGRAAPYYIESSGIEIFDKELYHNHFLKEGYYSLEWIAKKGTMGDEMWKVSKATKTFLKESDFYKNYHAQEGWEEIDWSMVLADYINSTIATLPTYNLEIINHDQRAIKVIGFYTKTIYTTGGEASPGGAHFPTMNKMNFFSLRWDKKNRLRLQKSVTIQAHKSATIPLSIFIEKGSQGDGPGQLTVALFIKYRERGKLKEELLTILNQSEDYGYLTGW